ncbi:small ribosomal subunit protein uS9m [Aulostomus maculatus]
MAAACVRTAGSLLGKYGSSWWSLSPVSSKVGSRALCVSSALHCKTMTGESMKKVTKEFLQEQAEEFKTGKRHLANMMGEDPDTFQQEDIDRSIAYLFPSGLFVKQARPLMKPPEEIFPKQRGVQWGEDRRPFHFLYYTGKPSYYNLMHETQAKIKNIENHQANLSAADAADVKPISLGTSRWISKDELQDVLVELVTDQDYNRFIQLMTHLLAMPNSTVEEAFIQRYRYQGEVKTMKKSVQLLHKDERGVAFATAEGKRKSAHSSVVLRDGGSGRIIINGKDYLCHFSVLQDREQLMFPFQFTDRLGRYDVEGTVSGGGRSSQAGALRLAISRALVSFLPETELESMRQAGLLTADPRVRERKKPGQEGARRKYTWKKR